MKHLTLYIYIYTKAFRNVIKEVNFLYKTFFIGEKKNGCYLNKKNKQSLPIQSCYNNDNNNTKKIV